MYPASNNQPWEATQPGAGATHGSCPVNDRKSVNELILGKGRQRGVYRPGQAGVSRSWGVGRRVVLVGLADTGGQEGRPGGSVRRGWGGQEEGRPGGLAGRGSGEEGRPGRVSRS